ncbi:MAG: DUF2339 domain-containing protein [Gemmatimonadota bacterium]|nr:MAG: DUF2339 domain-containing protein [Gemmatimonadota bacterium]
MPRPDATLEFETRVGTTWTLRIGLGAIAIAGALFARTIVPDLSPGAKVALAYAGSLLLFGVGRVYESKLERFARPVMAGGLSLGFFVSFAAHFVPAMRSIPLVASLAWMTGGVLSVLLLATRWGSQPTAGLAIFLGHVSAFVAAGDANGYSLIVIAFLSVTAVVLMQRHAWLPLSLFAVVAAYASHLLWTIVAHDTLPVQRALLLNILFLSSYYVIFLAADLLWWRRRAPAQDGARAPAVGRMLGPSNLVFYVSLVSFLYVAMAGPPLPIERFYFGVAAVQGGLALAYRRLRNPDYSFYAALATVLLTIGFIAALDALTLNLVLAVEALVLLLAAHRTRLRVFHLLAQVALLLNFLHYWTLATPPVVSLAVFLGGLAIAAVYFTQSQLEEAWYAEGARAWRDAAVPESVRPLAEWFDASFGRVARYLPYGYAVAGTVVLLRELLAYFPEGVAFGAVGVALALIAGAAAFLRSMPLSLAYLVAQGGIVLLARTAPPASLIGRVGITAAGLAAPTFLALMAARQTARVFLSRVLAITQIGLWLALVVLIQFVLAAAPLPPITGQYLVWIGLAVLVVVYADRATALWEARSHPEPGAVVGGAAAAVTAAGGGLVITLVTDRIVGMTLAAPVWTSLWIAALIGIAETRRGRAYWLAGFVLLGATYVYFLTWGGLGTAVAANAGASALVIGVSLVVAMARDRTPSGPAAGALGGPTNWAPYVAYACASAFLTYVLRERIGHPWAGTLLTIYPIGLLLAARVVGLSRAGTVAIVMAFVAVLYQVVGLVGQRYPLWPGLATLLAVVVVERVVERTVERRPLNDRDAEAENAVVSLALVAAGAGVALVAVYRSPWPAPEWAVVGWMLIATVLMGLALAWRALIYRLVALAVALVAVAQQLRLLVSAEDSVALPSGLATVLLIVGVERMVARTPRDDPDAVVGAAGVSVALVASAAALALVALYRSSWPGVAWTTAGWSVIGAAMMALGFAWRAAAYRRVALAVFACALVRVFVVDVRGLSSGGQTVAFLVLGVSLVAVAWLYARFGVALRKWL